MVMASTNHPPAHVPTHPQSNQRCRDWGLIAIWMCPVKFSTRRMRIIEEKWGLKYRKILVWKILLNMKKLSGPFPELTIISNLCAITRMLSEKYYSKLLIITSKFWTTILEKWLEMNFSIENLTKLLSYEEATEEHADRKGPLRSSI